MAVAGIKHEVVEKSQADDSTVAPPVDGFLQCVIIPGMPAWWLPGERLWVALQVAKPTDGKGQLDRWPDGTAIKIQPRLAGGPGT